MSRRVKVGINGFGRIGRLVCRAGLDAVEIVGINDLADVESMAHLLTYDSTHGRLAADVHTDGEQLIIDGQRVRVSREKDPSRIPWQSWGADIVLECTGVFKTRDDFARHLTAGARHVIVSAPADAADLTVVMGINHKQIQVGQHQIISNASCTTNCLAPVAQVIHQNFGIVHALMTTVHSYTNDQRVLDAHHKDLRRARGAAQSMIPTTTGAAKAVGLVLPELRGKLDGVSVRVPTPNVSLVDLVAVTTQPVTVATVNAALQAASEQDLKGILRCEAKPLVSSDFIGETASSVVDLPSTMVSGTHMLKVFAWYDNEMGFSHRMIDLAQYLDRSAS